MADLQRHLHGIPLERIRLFPPPGYASGDDVIAIAAREDRLCELEDGILVEKPIGWYESILAALILGRLHIYLREHDLGHVLGADGSFEILPDRVKIPDVSFIGWDRFPRKEMPRRPIPSLVPDFVVEVLSETNTPEEMDEKLKTYFRSGVRLVWILDPGTRTARSYSGSIDGVTAIDRDGILDGGEVLPGFQVGLRELFEEADRRGPKA